ncbi:hypothetical protein [Aquimarina sp. RZ0]|uniref:hypothetical protein n=1 Tax=Aquimarina sp. RZ0 TaxID=2607730 RepID=UPI0011F34931|nr:hypothetical protein [Aquimarina sp. RZ0]KAA1242463.1 hypothetical protein F0000_25425 [Aquimarina sp. RZ0]
MKTFFKSSIFIVLFSVIIGCSKSELQEPVEVSEIENTTYHFKGKTFSEKELTEVYGSDVFYNTDWFIEDENHAFLFDDKESRDDYAFKQNAKMNGGQLTFFESSRQRGRSVRINVKYNYQNLNRFWRNRVRSANSGNGVGYPITFYDRLNFRGQSKFFLIRKRFGGVFGSGTVLDGFKARADSFRIGR